jgi:hypothetical protein
MFEMTHRRLMPVSEALASIWIPDGYAPMYRRIFAEALSPDRRGLPTSEVRLVQRAAHTPPGQDQPDA